MAQVPKAITLTEILAAIGPARKPFFMAWTLRDQFINAVIRRNRDAITALISEVANTLAKVSVQESPKAINSITLANPPVINVPGHGFNADDEVVFDITSGMPQLGTRVYEIATPSANNIRLPGIDATGFTAFVSGTVRRVRRAMPVLDNNDVLAITALLEATDTIADPVQSIVWTAVHPPVITLLADGGMRVVTTFNSTTPGAVPVVKTRTFQKLTRAAYDQWVVEMSAELDARDASKAALEA